jgi:ubiquinone/menaquinone biosynthesis C-methylase UbiE
MPEPIDPVARTIAAYDAHAADYARSSASLDPVRDLLDAFLRMLPGNSPRHVLDVGCGPGRDAAYLAAHSCRVIGLDLSRAQLCWAAGHATASAFCQADMRQLPFQSNAFDGLWACASLLHLPRAQIPTALDELRRVARPGSLLYMGVKIGEGEGWSPAPALGGAVRYFTYFQPEEIAGLVTQAGFRVVELTNTELWINLFARAE